MSWRLAKCLTVLINEVNDAHPNRPKSADGTIGDAAHASRASDHNPNRYGVVTAWDCTTADFTITLAESLRQLGASGDKRVKYVIYRKRIAGPANRGWAWRPYDGANEHMHHIHLSVSGSPSQYDRIDPWFPKTRPTPKAAPKPVEREWDEMATKDEIRTVVAEELAKAVKTLHDDHVVLLRGTSTGSHPYNLTSIGKAVGADQPGIQP